MLWPTVGVFKCGVPRAHGRAPRSHVVCVLDSAILGSIDQAQVVFQQWNSALETTNTAENAAFDGLHSGAWRLASSSQPLA